MIRLKCIIVLLLLHQISIAQRVSISSSSLILEEAFEWASEKALSYVMTGKTGPLDISEVNKDTLELVPYIPSYWAVYPGRTGFYSRDFCHQSSGAYWLGLDLENFTMLKAFASTATESRKWYPLWALNFDGSTFKLDYRDDNFFVREVPVVFELVETAYKLYLTTGDKNYLYDEVLWNYYTKAVTDFIKFHDIRKPNGVPEGSGSLNIFHGVASYNEHDRPLLEAGDAIANQYQAFLAYSKLSALRGDKAVSKLFLKKAEELFAYFNSDWGIKNTHLYNRGYGMEKEPLSDWGKENSWFMPMKGITDPNSERTWAFLDYIYHCMKDPVMIPNNIEAISYMPEVFFRYHQNERGWEWMKYILNAREEAHLMHDLTGTNGDYPEISYDMITNIVEQLAGIVPNAPGNKVSTTPHLPNEIETLEIKHARIGDARVTVSHTGNVSTNLAYDTGIGPMQWEVIFPGKYRHLYVNGKRIKAS